MMRPPALLPLAASILFLLGPGQALQALAAPPTPVHWTVAEPPAHPVARGPALVLTVSAHIQPGWHIYALDEPEGGPIPTQIGVAEGDPLTLLAVDGPQPRMVPDAVLHQPTGMFQNQVNFSVRVQAPRKPLAQDAVSHILVRYQSCNDQVCLPPRTDTVAVPLKNLLQ